ncbi:FG-GAP repeat protein [Nonomuraea sp. NPDC003560]|uniref:FG-GAP repeat protein n=1 Tax=Nonomuraea sp. NPDC003560 TaxID=3364341 RepID=UPI0036C81F35
MSRRRRVAASVKVLDVTGDGKAEVVAGAPAQSCRAGRPAVLRGSSGCVLATGTQVCHADQFGPASPDTAFGKLLAR